MKKLLTLLILMLVLCGCQSNGEMDVKYRGILTNFKFEENTYITLVADNQKAASISVCANNDLAFISMYTEDYKVDQYYAGKIEYVHLIGPNGVDKYYKVKIDEVFNSSMDIYNKLVFNPKDIGQVSFVETVDLNGVQTDCVKGKIGNHNTEFYFECATAKLVKVVFKGDSSLNIEKGELSLPSQFDNCEETTAEVINEFISEFTASII